MPLGVLEDKGQAILSGVSNGGTWVQITLNPVRELTDYFTA
jgi:hypothetical protein